MFPVPTLWEPSALPRDLDGGYLGNQIMELDLYGLPNFSSKGEEVLMADLPSYIPENSCLPSFYSVGELLAFPRDFVGVSLILLFKIGTKIYLQKER